MARRTDEEIFLSRVPTDGTSIGNMSLRTELGWDGDKYQRVRQRLLDRDLIHLRKGKGGSVRLVKGDKRALLRCVPKDGSDISSSRVREQLGWDEDLHHEVLGWLVGDGVLLTKRVGKEATIVRAHREVTPEEGKEMEEKALLALLPRDESGFSIQDILKRLKWSEARFWEVYARLIQKGRVNKPPATRTVAYPPQSATKRKPTEIFFSYSHHDRDEMLILDQHLSGLKRQGLVTVWHDGQITPGADWSNSIHENLERAQVVVLLISRNFLASDYCYSKEMHRALERHRKGDIEVIPVILNHVTGS